MTEDGKTISLYKRTFKDAIKKTDHRSSDKAAEKLKEEVEHYADFLIRESTGLADHAERKTVKEKDVTKAIQIKNFSKDTR